MNTRKAMTTIVMLVVLMLLSQIVHAERRVRPFNRVVVMIDESDTFYKHRAEAIQKADELIGKISNEKRKKHEGKDEIIVISLDAIPETIWSGTREQLVAEGPQKWKQRFDARSDYRNCTDVENGFILAAQELHKEPQATNLYLFVFSDLINEPPAGSASKCAPVSLPSVPSQGFPWEAFEDVEVHVLWVPIDQKQAWFKAVNAVKLGTSFHLHSQSESSVVELKSPPKARRTMTEQEREDGRAKTKGFFLGIGRAFLYGAGVFIALVAAGGMLTTFIVRRRNSRKGR